MLKLENIQVKKELHPFVRKITVFKSKGAINYIQKLMPSGYSYLAFNQQNRSVFKVNGHDFSSIGELQVAGPKTKSNIHVRHLGVIGQILIEFTATGFYRLFKQSPLSIQNILADYANFISAPMQKELLGGISLTKNEAEKTVLVQEHLVRLATGAIGIDMRIQKAIDQMEELKGVMTVNDANQVANIGERHFNRLFVQIVGCSPKLFLKILQLHYIISEMADNDKNKMLDVAYLSGFYDQAHFNKSFKKLVNLSPSKFLNSKEHVSLQYFKGAL